MTVLIEQLERDHVNLAGLLKILEAEIDTVDRVEEPDFQLMSMILDYLLTYPDEVHHPKEDVLYAMLLTRQPALRDTVGDLDEEHVRLAALTRQLADGLRSAVGGSLVGRDWLSQIARTFIQTYRDHMQNENTEIFPLARRHLTAEDWALAQTEFSPDDDPLFGANTDVGFERLLKRIQISAGAAP